jgi:hypothetical protein
LGPLLPDDSQELGGRRPVLSYQSRRKLVTMHVCRLLYIAFYIQCQ